VSAAAADAFAARLVGDAAAMTQVVMATIGDRLGLWKDLAAAGPATSVELARRMGLSERHVREWLAAMAAAGYLAYDPATRRFALPDAHVAALAGDDSFVGGMHHMLVAYLRPLERIVETFRTGGGVPQSAYPDAAYEGQARFSAALYATRLVPVWLPAAGLDGALADGIDVCDVGCGAGRALVTLATTYPRSRFVGYDVYGPNVQRARVAAERAGVAGRVRFFQLDAAAGLPQRFDLITTFDVVHDAIDPRGLLAAIRAALCTGGAYLCLEVACNERLEDNFGPLGALQHGVSVLYCLSTSLAHGGAGLGACGVHEPGLRALAAEAGFGDVRRLPVDDGFHHLYLLGA
jgi:SAM-dependent methyltransferase